MGHDQSYIDRRQSSRHVDFEPFLTDGTDNQPNVSGFQPLATQGGVITVSVVNGQLIVEGSNDDDIVTITVSARSTRNGIYEITTQQGANRRKHRLSAA